MRTNLFYYIVFLFYLFDTPSNCSVIKEGGGYIKEKFKEFLRKAVYGITPTTIYTTLRPRRFPEEYDPVAILKWQLAEEHRRGITTMDYEPKLTDVTELWDGYWNDPTIFDVNPWDDRHEEAAYGTKSTTVRQYWDPTYGHEKSIEAIAKYWKAKALEENEEWWRTVVTRKQIPLEHMTYDSVEKVKVHTNFDEELDSEENRMLLEAQVKADADFEAKFNVTVASDYK